MKFEWNPDKAVINLRKHIISFQEATTVFDDSLSTTFPDLDYSVGEDRYIIIGMSKAGQLLVVSHTDRENHTRIISAPRATRQGDFMKKEKEVDELNDDLRPEYDFSKMAGGVKGKYVERYRAGTNLVLLESDIAQAFPTDASVEALRLLMHIAQRQQPNNPVGAD